MVKKMAGKGKPKPKRVAPEIVRGPEELTSDLETELQKKTSKPQSCPRCRTKAKKLSTIQEYGTVEEEADTTNTVRWLFAGLAVYGLVMLCGVSEMLWRLLAYEAAALNHPTLGFEKHVMATLGFLAMTGVCWGCLVGGVIGFTRTPKAARTKSISAFWRAATHRPYWDVCIAAAAVVAFVVYLLVR